MSIGVDPSPQAVKAAREFLQTVVVVDDRALNPIRQAEEDLVEDEPVVRHRGVVGSLQVPEDVVGDQHDLDAKRISQAFARHGLVCALLSPTSADPLADEVLKAASRADLVVLDWVLDRDDGRAAMQLLAALLRSDSRPGVDRLRAIAIYTGQPELPDIADKLARLLASYYPEHALVRHDDGLTMTKGPLRIALFAKENVPDPAGLLESRRVSLEDLPARLEREFAAHSEGLMTSLTIRSLAALRDDTHRLISVLGPSLDRGFLGHRSALPEAPDAESHALDLVLSEVRSILEDHRVGSSVALPVLKEWLSGFRPGDAELGGIIANSKSLSRDQVVRILEVGLGSDGAIDEVAAMGTATSKSFLKSVKKCATKVFSETDEEAAESDAEFANRMILRTVYAASERVLQLGVIVRSPASEYLLCVQPLCDCVRLKNEVKSFPFVRIDVTDANRYDLRLSRGRGAPQFLKLGASPSDVVSLRFKPKAGRTLILAEEVRRGFIFSDTRNRKYHWAAQLKPEFAQKIVGDLAASFARVAVNEAELRRLG